MSPAPNIDFRTVDGSEADRYLEELGQVYLEVQAEPPYEYGAEHLALFKERFEAQRHVPGFSLILARDGAELVGFGFGLTLQPSSPWWRGLLNPVPDDVTREYPGRTFALISLYVRRPWRRRHIAKTIHDLLLKDRQEERATLTVRPDAEPAQAAYAKWGWRKVAQKRNPLPGAPVFDVMVKELRRTGSA